MCGITSLAPLRKLSEQTPWVTTSSGSNNTGNWRPQWIECGSLGAHQKVRMASSTSNKDSPGKRHHYVPASYLGRFSANPTKRYRRRPLYVARRGLGRAFLQSAENLAFQDDLYALADPNPSWLGTH